ncbi:MAG: glycosyltransferase 87 family protein [Candidatus Baltobacteraceae bacterium]
MLKITFGLLAVLGFLSVGIFATHLPKENGLDFQAFYCGSQAVAHHANPYTNQPLHDCEARTSPAFFTNNRNVTVPAPLPPYALVLLVPFAMLPYTIAKMVWILLLAGCIVLIPFLIVRIAGLPLSVAAAASIIAVAGTTMLQLALAPLPIALLCITALLVRQKRWNAAAACGTLSMIEPHVALPVCLALFFFVPALRLRFVAGATALACLSLLATGPRVLLWYFTDLLPAHAVSEFNNLGQFSLTTLLYHAGVPGQLALRAGSLEYALMVVFGIWAALGLSRRYNDGAYLVLVPAACSVVGGSFMHLSEIAIAIPLACMLAQQTRSSVSWVALALLAIPWEAIFNWAFLVPFACLSLVWLIWYRWKPMPLILLLSAVALTLIDLRLHAIAVNEFLSVHAQAQIAAVRPDASSDVTWAAFNALSSNGPFWWVEKSFTLVALALLIAVLAATFRKSVQGISSI